MMITEVIDIFIIQIILYLSCSTSVALFQLSTLAKVIIYYNRWSYPHDWMWARSSLLYRHHYHHHQLVTVSQVVELVSGSSETSDHAVLIQRIARSSGVVGGYWCSCLPAKMELPQLKHSKPLRRQRTLSVVQCSVKNQPSPRQPSEMFCFSASSGHFDLTDDIKWL